MAAPSAPQPPLSRRDRRKQETISDIKHAALRQLAEAGPAGISMRAIARELDMTASAVHYYFPGRQALIEAWPSTVSPRWPAPCAQPMSDPQGFRPASGGWP
ncbi:MAG: helix-turn-helix transcriptional regulator [Streptosporangiaceae bacterium]|nr:helix-turn-helix transcriptional regulator [Streptosporangiaceae bacterium]